MDRDLATADLRLLLADYPPPFIFVNDHTAFGSTQQAVESLLDSLCTNPPGAATDPVKPFKFAYAHVDATGCYTPRLLYERIIHGLTHWEPSWENGCANWGIEQIAKDEAAMMGGLASTLGMLRWNESFDGFLHALRALHELLRIRSGVYGRVPDTGKGKGKAKDTTSSGLYEDVRIILAVSNPDRLKELMPEVFVPLTRVAELARIDLSLLFLSRVSWGEIRPVFGACPDPYYVDVPPWTKPNTVKRLLEAFDPLCAEASSSSAFANCYQPQLKSLYVHFVTILVDVCFPIIHDPQELQYTAAARWPGFVKPILDDYKQKVQRARAEHQEASRRATSQSGGELDDVVMDSEEEDYFDETEVPFDPPSEDIRVRLMRYFSASFTNALQVLHPRRTNASDWAKDNAPPDNLLDIPPEQLQPQPQATDGSKPIIDAVNLNTLPRMSKFTLIAAFLASTNQAKVDIRLFGRGEGDSKKRSRRRAAPASPMKRSPSKKTGAGTNSSNNVNVNAPAVDAASSKIPQRLLGPLPFPFDRLLAILGALLEEHDAATRESILPSRSGFFIPGEWTDYETGRVGLYAALMELVGVRLLLRTSAGERLDGPPMFKCGVSYEQVLGLAKDLGVPLNDLLWDPL